MPGGLTAAPLTAAEIDAPVHALLGGAPSSLAVAVSGGPDSLALTLVLAAWGERAGVDVRALTVDHGLRPDAEREAAWTKAVCRARGIAHAIVHPAEPLPAGAGQARARDARYDALLRACAQRGIGTLALAHHREDQAETVLLRARRDSGPAGLAGMPARREAGGVQLIRPVLNVPKARLVATLDAAGVGWVRDPTNADFKHARPRVRAAMAASPELDAAALARLARAMGRARASVEGAAISVVAAHAAWGPGGHAWLRADAVASPAPVAREVLARLLAAVGGTSGQPRAGQLDALRREMHGGAPRTHTLGGCVLVPRRGGWVIAREPGRTPVTPLVPGVEARHDGRVRVVLARGAPGGLRAGALGAAGWRSVTAESPGLRGCGIPPPARPALTAVWDAGGPVAVPDLGWLRPGAPARAWPVAWTVHAAARWDAPPFAVAPPGFGIT